MRPMLMLWLFVYWSRARKRAHKCFSSYYYFLLVGQLSTNGKQTERSPEGKQWDRLYRTSTLSSSRREVFHHDPQVAESSIGAYMKLVHIVCVNFPSRPIFTDQLLYKHAQSHKSHDLHLMGGHSVEDGTFIFSNKTRFITPSQNNCSDMSMWWKQIILFQTNWLFSLFLNKHTMLLGWLEFAHINAHVVLVYMQNILGEWGTHSHPRIKLTECTL